MPAAKVVVSPRKSETLFMTDPTIAAKVRANIRRLENDRRRNEDQFRQLADSIPQLAWMADAQGALYWYNQRWLDYTGATFADMEGWGWQRVHHPDHLDRVMEKWKLALKKGEGWEDTFPLRGRDGEYRWFLSRAFPIRDEAGRILRWFGTNTDITERLQAEEALRVSEARLQEALKAAEEARERAVEANLRKDDFLANMSHELRTPLNAIVGLGHILARSHPLTDRQRNCIATLQTSSDSLMALINDLLDIARIESESIMLENVDFNLREALAEIVSVCSVKANEKKIPLTLHYAPELAENFIGDPHRIKQIVMNLLSNAVKFTEQGHVDLRVERLRERNGLSEIAIRVIDTGIGIEPKKLEYVFEKFSQGDTSINRKYGGTGLGLAISKALARLLGGDISVMSEAQKGSCFTLAVPLARRSPLPGESAESFIDTPVTGAPEHAPRVLIVEDYMPNLLVACAYLDMLGLRYDTAASGEEALRKVSAGGVYNAIMMDVQMGGMDGLSATRAIREYEREHGRDPVPVLGVTAYALKGDREKCLEAGMSDYLSKPFTPEVLGEKIHALVRQTAAA